MHRDREGKQDLVREDDENQAKDSEVWQFALEAESQRLSSKTEDEGNQQRELDHAEQDPEEGVAL